MDIQDFKNRFGKIKNLLWKNILPKLSEEELDELSKMLNEHPEYLNERNLLYCLIHDINLPSCKNCGKTLNYDQFGRGGEYCCPSCRDSSKEVRKKVEVTSLEKFGVSCILKLFPKKVDEEVLKERRAKKELEKKALDQEKRFGVSYEEKILTPQEKSEIIFLKKYNVVSPFLISEVKEKRLEGVKRFFSDKSSEKYLEAAKKRKESFEERYGVSSYYLTEEYQNSIKLASRKRMWVKITSEEWKKYVTPFFTQEEFLDFNVNDFLWKCSSCGSVFEAKFKQHFHPKIEKGTFLPRCLKCYPYLRGRSQEEKDLFKIVKDLTSFKVIENTRKILGGHEIDIFVPDLKLGIEFDGLYWHNEEKIGKNYHKEKTDLCEMKGVRLIHIFEDFWNHRKDDTIKLIRESLFVDRISLKSKDCEVKELTKKEVLKFKINNFFESSSFTYGLLYQDIIVFAISFCSKNISMILDISQDYRFTIDNPLIEVLSFIKQKKLISHFSYLSDRRVSNPFFLKRIGLKKINDSDPYAISFTKDLKTSKNIIENQLVFNFDSTDDIIWDCGKRKYEISV